jgi:hypothetical protein
LAGVRLDSELIERRTCALEKFRSTFDIETMTDDDLRSSEVPQSVAEAADAAVAGC